MSAVNPGRYLWENGHCCKVGFNSCLFTCSGTQCAQLSDVFSFKMNQSSECYSLSKSRYVSVTVNKYQSSTVPTTKYIFLWTVPSQYHTKCYSYLVHYFLQFFNKAFAVKMFTGMVQVARVTGLIVRLLKICFDYTSSSSKLGMFFAPYTAVTVPL